MIKVLTYKVENNVFSGDSYIPGVKLIASFPNSDREDARILKERIMELTKDCSLYSGHGNIYSKLSRYLEKIYKAVSFLFYSPLCEESEV